VRIPTDTPFAGGAPESASLIHSDFNIAIIGPDMKKLFATVAILTAISTPSFAQSFDPDLGTGNIAAVSRETSVQPKHKMARQKRGADSFASVPGFRSNSDDPVLTGGGSVGYNESLRNY
jgi:hypothetical protein